MQPATSATEWFRRRTFDSAHVDVDALGALRRRSGTSVSVVLPSRNEGETITAMVEAVTSLCPALVDEVVVVDAGSTDATPALAEQAGATVVQEADLLAEVGPVQGKGDALWRSLRATSGDVVAFVDSDIRNPHPRFVSGLLGPLLTDPAIGLVKGFYERPLEVAGALESGGGGRVTELMARPLLNLYWPELAGLVQPLSGEYAGRRWLLESIPFFTGYGVELGLLIDTCRRLGADAIAQVDLAERVHTNQPLEVLSRMAFGLLQVADRRLGDDGRTPDRGQPPPYLQFTRRCGPVEVETHDARVVERPPMRDYAGTGSRNQTTS